MTSYSRRNPCVIVYEREIRDLPGFCMRLYGYTLYSKKYKKVLALYNLLLYNHSCCDIDSVEAEVAT